MSDSAAQTPFQYAKAQFAAERFPQIDIQEFGGAFYLCDGDFNLLKGKSYTDRHVAMSDRSKILARAQKAVF